MQTTLANMQFNVIEQRLRALSETTTTIHVTITNKRNKVIDAPSKIIGIYERFVCVESKVQNYLEKFTINYYDLMTGNILIKELS